MKKHILYMLMGCLAVLALAGAVNGFAEAVPVEKDIDIVWTKSDGIRPEIFYTSKVAGGWSEPVMVTDDYYDNMHPVIDRDSGDTRWLFWTAYDNNRTEIRYATGSAGEWESSQTLADELTSNSGPSVVIDENDSVWVVWSASDGGPDDIYYAVNRDGEWSDPRIFHEPNDVPDTLPVVSLTDEGMVSVSWKQVQGDKYVLVTKDYDGAEWSLPVASEIADEDEKDDSEADRIVLPEFINPNGRVFIRVY